MVRVAQVMAGAAQGGAEAFFTRLATGLQASGRIQQRAFIRDAGSRVDDLRAAGVSVDTWRFGGVVHQLDRWHFRRALRSYHPDIVLAWMNRATQATPRGGYKLVSRLGNYYDLKYHRHADFWVGNSAGICDYLVQGGMPSHRVFRIPNFANEAPAEALPRTSFATPPGVPVILSAGRLHRDKAFDTLLQALVLCTDAVLWLAGDGPEKPMLQQLCRDLGLESRVRFLGWRQDVTSLMRSVDLFVCSSRHEGLGSIILESWAHGCPIVATAAQGPGELIDSGTTGLLVPVDKPDALATAIRELLQNPAERQQLADNARAHYYRQFSKSIILERYEELFETVR
ncbi:MAG: glycosyl transferase [Alteromonadaceae bacterium]|nr:glycosyl transferase [Alteromonadaceae bacterium]